MVRKSLNAPCAFLWDYKHPLMFRISGLSSLVKYHRESQKRDIDPDLKVRFAELIKERKKAGPSRPRLMSIHDLNRDLHLRSSSIDADEGGFPYPHKQRPPYPATLGRLPSASRTFSSLCS